MTTPHERWPHIWALNTQRDTLKYVLRSDQRACVALFDAIEAHVTSLEADNGYLRMVLEKIKEVVG